MSAPSPVPFQPIPFRVLLDQAMVLTRRHFRAAFPLPAVVFPAGAVLMVIAQAVMFRNMRFGTVGRPPTQLLAGLGFFALAMLVYMAFLVVAAAATTAVAVDAVAGRPIRLGYRVAGVFGPRFLGTLLLGLVLTGIAFVFCFFPALYVSLLFILVVPVMVEEGRFGPRALGRSKDLIRYNPQRRFLNAPLVKAFTILLVTWLLSAVAGSIVQVPFGIAKQVVIFREVAAHGAGTGAVSPVVPWLDVPAAVLGGLVSAVVQLYGAFATAILFFDLRARKEGVDLEAAIVAIEATGGAGEPPATGSAAPAAPDVTPPPPTEPR